MHAHDMYALENHVLESHALESHAYKRYPYKNPFCYSIPPYRWKDPTKPKPAHPLNYKLWWMMLARRTFLDFRNLGFGSFCHPTPPHFEILGVPQYPRIRTWTRISPLRLRFRSMLGTGLNSEAPLFPSNRRAGMEREIRREY